MTVINFSRNGRSQELIVITDNLMKYFMQSNVELLLQSSYHQVSVFNQLLWSTTVYFVFCLFKNFLLGEGQLSHAPAPVKIGQEQKNIPVGCVPPAWKPNVLQFHWSPPDDAPRGRSPQI